MSSGPRNRLAATVSARLTFWYSLISIASLALAFAVAYLVIASDLSRRIDQDMADEAREFSTVLASQGLQGLKAYIKLESESANPPEEIYQVFDSQGRLVASSDPGAWPGRPPLSPADLKRALAGSPVFSTISLPGPLKKARLLCAAIGPGLVLRIGQSLDDTERLLSELRRVFGAVTAIGLVLAALAGWFMARRALSGVAALTRTAAEIGRQDLESRVPVSGSGDEIDELARTFNAMLDRIQGLVAGMKEMTDSVAHDLRGPVARIRLAAEMALEGGTGGQKPAGMAAAVVEECDQLLALINTTLAISEAEAGLTRLETVRLDLAGLAQEAAELFRPVAEDKGIELRVEASSPAEVAGDRRKLQRAVANLLDNAIKYTPRGGSVSVGVVLEAGRVVLNVRDSGPGIPEADLLRIFDRFYRGDQSRSQPGHGLGLSLTRAFVSLHQGRISVASAPGQGSTFTVSLPRHSAA